MNTNQYSESECLWILKLISCLETNATFVMIDYEVLGENLIQKILDMDRRQRIELVKEVAGYL
jgi:hypothetical protein